MKEKQFGSFYWEGSTLRLNYMIDGERQRPWFARMRIGSKAEKRNLEQEARNRLNEIEVAMRHGEFFDSTPYPTYKQMALHYWEKFQSIKQYMIDDPNCYRSDFSKLMITIEHFGDKKADLIKREDIKNFRMYLRELGDSDKVRKKWENAYINRIVACVGQVFKHCISQELWRFESASMDERIRYGNIDVCVKLENPIHGLPKLEEDPKPPIIPTREKFRALLDNLMPVYRDMAIIGVHTGLRRRNVVKLQISEISIESAEIYIKGHKGRSEPTIKKLHTEAVDVLRSRLRYIKENGIETKYIFCKPDGNPYKDFYRHWRKACKAADLDGFWFEHLRPTYASWRVEEKVSMPLLQRQLDHSTSQTTSRFYNKSSAASEEILKTQRAIFEPVLVGAPDETLTNPDRNPDNFLTKWMPVSAAIFRNHNFN